MDLEAKKRFAEIIVNLRAGRDLRSFARELGVQHSTIIDWESCNTIPKRPNLEKIARLRGETVNELMDYLEGRQALSHSSSTRNSFEELNLVPSLNFDAHSFFSRAYHPSC